MIQLIINSPRSPLEDLLKLKALLPSEIVSATEVLDTDTVDEMPEIPRVIAIFGTATEKDVQTITGALIDASITDMEIINGPIAFLPLAVPGCELLSNDVIGDPRFYSCTESELAANDAKTMNIAKILNHIMEAKSSGVPFPETQYTGDQKLAYDSICRMLPGKPPIEDKGNSLMPDDIEKYRDKPTDNISTSVWNEVVDHLLLEVKYFIFESKWFGDNGHMRTALLNKQFYDYHFVDFLNEHYLKLPDKTTMTVVLDVYMGTAIRAIGAVAGPAMGAVASALWTVTKAGMPNPEGRITGQLKVIKDEIFENFHKTIKKLEQTDVKLSEDWGLLNQFGALIRDEGLSWPRDLSKIRQASAKSFQFCALRSLLHLKGGQSISSYDTFGVVQSRRISDKPRTREWTNYHLYTHSEERSKCGVTRNYYYECYLGWQHLITTIQPATYTYSEASQSLQAKLFGNASSETDPQFNLDAGFLLYPKRKPREDWVLPQLIDNSDLRK